MAITRMARRRRKKWLRNAVIFTSICLCVVVGYLAYSIFSVKGALEKSEVELQRKDNKSELREEAVSYSNEPFSVLILGLEEYAKNTDTARADTQIVATFNPAASTVRLVSVPRDTRVQIDNAGQYTGVHKINSAMTYGELNGYGAEKLQVETTEKLLNIPIDAFVTVNFDGFRDVVNALGGITVDIKHPFWEDNVYTDERIDFVAGETRLTGEEALAFVRMRKREVNSIYSRDERQRQFIAATVNQAKSAGTIMKVGELTKIFGNNVKTNFTVSDLFAIQKQYMTMDSLKIESTEIKGTNMRINGLSYFVADQTELQNLSMQLRSDLNLSNEEPFKTSASFGAY